jgi:hypothetical protein
VLSRFHFCIRVHTSTIDFLPPEMFTHMSPLSTTGLNKNVGGCSVVVLYIIEELAAFPPARRVLFNGEQGPNAKMVALLTYVLGVMGQAAGPLASQQPRVEPEVALTALKAMTGLLTAWRLEGPPSSSSSSSSAAAAAAAPSTSSSLIAALQDQDPQGASPFLLSLVQATVVLVGSALLPYEVKNQAGLVLVLAALDASDHSHAPALAHALAACFLPTTSSSSSTRTEAPHLGPLHPSLRGLPTTLSPLLLLHTQPRTPSSVASEARLALARAVLVATDLGVLTAPLPPAVLAAGEYDASVAAGGTLMGGACVRA